MLWFLPCLLQSGNQVVPRPPVQPEARLRVYVIKCKLINTNTRPPLHMHKEHSHQTRATQMNCSCLCLLANQAQRLLSDFEGMPIQTWRYLRHFCGRDVWCLQWPSLRPPVSLEVGSQNSYCSSYFILKFTVLSHTESKEHPPWRKQVRVELYKKILKGRPDWSSGRGIG